MSACDRTSAVHFFFFYFCLSLLTQTVPSSREKYHFCLCVALVKHTIQGDTIYLSSAFSLRRGASQPPPGARRTITAGYHQIITVEPQENVARVNKESGCACLCVPVCCTLHFPMFAFKCSCMDACFVPPTTAQ